MKTILTGLWRHDSGDDVAEYALLVGVIVLAVLVAVFSFGVSNGKRINDTATTLSNGSSGGASGGSAGQSGGTSQGGSAGQSGGSGQGGAGSGSSGGQGGNVGGQSGGVPAAPVTVK